MKKQKPEIHKKWIPQGTKMVTVNCPKCKKELKSPNYICKNCNIQVVLYLKIEDRFWSK